MTSGSGYDVMVLAPHPDDAEMACAGVILQLVAARKQVAIVDMTRGEMGTRGTPELRAQECEAATKMMGVHHRRNLGLPDAGLEDDAATLATVVAVIRELRPRILLAPHWRDIHPDHRTAAHVARRAFFHSGLANFQPQQPPWRPRQLAYYPGNDPITPSFCVDITAEAEEKRQIVECYASQVQDPDASHLVRGLSYMQRIETRDRYFGGLIGTAAAEPFTIEGPVPFSNFASLLDS